MANVLNKVSTLEMESRVTDLKFQVEQIRTERDELLEEIDRLQDMHINPLREESRLLTRKMDKMNGKIIRLEDAIKIAECERCRWIFLGVDRRWDRANSNEWRMVTEGVRLVCASGCATKQVSVEDWGRLKLIPARRRFSV